MLINYLKIFVCRQSRAHPRKQAGFTLLEMMIAMTVGLFVIGAIYSVYITQLHLQAGQRIKAALQQNLRSAMIIMEQEIRMIGFDPEDTGQFGIIGVQRYDLVGTKINADGSPALFYTVDEDENGQLGNGKNSRNKEYSNFRIREDSKAKRFYLAWSRGMGRFPLAENIKAIGLAYGVDSNDDGLLDRWDDGPHFIWAVDSDNDNLLDTHLDANNDGTIDETDDVNGDGRITYEDGSPINPPLPVSCIKSVRLWLLAQSYTNSKRFKDETVYVVGDRLIRASNDGYMRQLLSTIVDCRNL